MAEPVKPTRRYRPYLRGPGRTLHAFIIHAETAEMMPLMRRIYTDLVKCKNTFVAVAAYGFLAESALPFIFPESYTDPEPVGLFSWRNSNVDKLAYGGAVAASAFAIILRLQRGKGVLRGWERYEGAASLGLLLELWQVAIIGIVLSGWRSCVGQPGKAILGCSRLETMTPGREA